MNSRFRALFSLHFLNDGIRAMIISLLPFVAKEMALTFTQVGFIGTSQSVMGILMALPGGLLASKIGGIKMLLLAMILYTGCLYLIGLSPHVVLLYAAYFLAAIGFAPFHIVGQSITARESSKEQMGRNLSNFTVIGESGRVIFPAIALFLSAAYGWRPTILGTAILCSFLFLLFFSQWKKNKNSLRDDTKYVKKEKSIDWLKQSYYLLKQKKMLLVSLTGFLDNIGGNAIYIFLPFLLLAKGIYSYQLGFFMGAFFLGTFSGKVILGRAVDRFGNIKILFAAELLMALFVILLTLANTFVLFLLLCFMLGIFTRGTTPVISTLYTETSHHTHYEKVYAVSEIFLGIAGALSAIILGFMADHFGIITSFYASAFFTTSVIIPLSIYAMERTQAPSKI